MGGGKEGEKIELREETEERESLSLSVVGAVCACWRGSGLLVTREEGLHSIKKWLFRADWVCLLDG